MRSSSSFLETPPSFLAFSISAQMPGSIHLARAYMNLEA